jgi:hypothetical protein
MRNEKGRETLNIECRSEEVHFQMPCCLDALLPCYLVTLLFK